jgi:hypothetical protein
MSLGGGIVTAVFGLLRQCIMPQDVRTPEEIQREKLDVLRERLISVMADANQLRKTLTKQRRIAKNVGADARVKVVAYGETSVLAKRAVSQKRWEDESVVQLQETLEDVEKTRVEILREMFTIKQKMRTITVERFENTSIVLEDSMRQLESETDKMVQQAEDFSNACAGLRRR